MNNTSGSVLPKITFGLVLCIAAAAGYLVVRERIRSMEERRARERAEELATNAQPAPFVAPTPARPTPTQFAPLRPRTVTNNGVMTRTQLVPRPVAAVQPRIVVNPPEPAAAPTPVMAVAQPAAQFVPNVAVAGGGGVGRPVGKLTGRVFLNGKPPPEKRITLDSACAKLQPAPVFTRHFVVGQDGGLGDVFVYVKDAPPRPVAGPGPLLDQVGCVYTPYMIGVQTQQTFTVRNSDPLMHNVHVVPKMPGNRERNVSQPVRGMVHTFSFDAPEIFVQFKCDVHPWMYAYVGVVSHPWFAVTDVNGNFTIPDGLPPGDYTLAAVHRKAGEQTLRLTLPLTTDAPLSFSLDVPKP